MTRFLYANGRYFFYIIVFCFVGCNNTCNENSTYYQNGKLKIKAMICNSKMNGYFQEYFENGKLKTKGNYNNGFRSKIFYEYYKDGSLYGVDNYIKGKLDGFSLGYDRRWKLFIIYENNDIVKQIVVDTLNQVISNYYSKLNNLTINYVTNWKIYKINKGDTIYFDSNKKLLKFVSKNKTELKTEEEEEYRKLIPDWKSEIIEWEKGFKAQF